MDWGEGVAFCGGAVFWLVHVCGGYCVGVGIGAVCVIGSFTGGGTRRRRGDMIGGTTVSGIRA